MLVAAATAMAPTAYTTADPDDPGGTSTSMPDVSEPAVAVTPAADPGAAATASATVAGSQPQQNSQPQNSQPQNSQPQNSRLRSTVRQRLSHRRRLSTSQRPSGAAPSNGDPSCRAGRRCRWCPSRSGRWQRAVSSHGCSPPPLPDSARRTSSPPESYCPDRRRR